jgi:hypothetical protein
LGVERKLITRLRRELAPLAYMSGKRNSEHHSGSTTAARAFPG